VVKPWGFADPMEKLGKPGRKALLDGEERGKILGGKGRRKTRKLRSRQELRCEKELDSRNARANTREKEVPLRKKNKQKKSYYY